MWALCATARLYKSCPFFLVQVISTKGVLLWRFLTTYRLTEFTTPKTHTKTYGQIWTCQLSKGWHGFPQLVHSFSLNYVVYILYDSFLRGPFDNFNGFTVQKQVLAELRSCSPKHFVEMGVAENDTMWLSYDSRIWLNDTYAIYYEKNHSRSLPPTAWVCTSTCRKRESGRVAVTGGDSKYSTTYAFCTIFALMELCNTDLGNFVLWNTEGMGTLSGPRQTCQTPLETTKKKETISPQTLLTTW